MIKAYFANVRKSNSLTAKIRDAEQQLLIRQRGVGVRTDALIKKIHREMTAPSTLLMTVGIGFILGELTKRRSSSNHPVSGKQQHERGFPFEDRAKPHNLGTHFIHGLAHSLEDQDFPSISQAGPSSSRTASPAGNICFLCG